MTKPMSSLQHELDQWEHDLAALTDDLTAGELSLPEQLMATVQDTLTAYRGRILPRMALDHDPAVADELNHAVDRLEVIRRDLVAGTPTAKLQTQVSETLAVLRVLTKVARRRDHT